MSFQPVSHGFFTCDHCGKIHLIYSSEDTTPSKLKTSEWTTIVVDNKTLHFCPMCSMIDSLWAGFKSIVMVNGLL